MLAQPHVVAYFQSPASSGLNHFAVQALPHLGFVGGIDVARCHADAPVHVSVILLHQRWDHVHVPSGVGCREVVV